MPTNSLERSQRLRAPTMIKLQIVHCVAVRLHWIQLLNLLPLRCWCGNHDHRLAAGRCVIRVHFLQFIVTADAITGYRSVQMDVNSNKSIQTSDMHHQSQRRARNPELNRSAWATALVNVWKNSPQTDIDVHLCCSSIYVCVAQI